jgi:hypothetical protein
MPMTVSRTISRRTWFYVAVVILVLLVGGIQYYKNSRIYDEATVISESPYTPTPSGWQKMVVETMTQANGQLTSLGTALLGALGLLVGRARNGSKFRHFWAASFAAAAAALSLYFGYTGHLKILSMINTQFVNLDDPVYTFSMNAQFYTLLAAAFFFADFAFHDLSRED